MADPAVLQRLATHFDNTLSLDPAVRNQATDEIRALETRSGSAILLLTLITQTGFSQQTRLAAAINFKNFIMNHWDDEATPTSLLPTPERDTIKQNLPNLMLSSPSPIQQQLSQVLAIISLSDFPWQWPTLLPDIIARFKSQPDDHTVMMGCLETLHSIFYHYRADIPSNELYSEINYVLEHLADPLTTLFLYTIGQTSALEQQPAALIALYTRIDLILNLYWSLNAQDLPDYFEENLSKWFTPMQAILQYKNPAFQQSSNSSNGGSGNTNMSSSSNDEAEPTVLENCQSTICEIITLHATKYETQFNSYTASFVSIIWQLCTSLSTSLQYDNVISTAIKFLTAVISKSWNRNLFANEATLTTIIQSIIIPNIMLREADLTMFEQDGMEYIRRDMEGSDIDTRRRVTIDFVRILASTFEMEFSELMKKYVTQLLSPTATTTPATGTATSNSNTKQQLINKDAAIYLILALSSKTQTRAKGITAMNQYIDVPSFFSTQILPELQQQGSTNTTTSRSSSKDAASAIIQADCLKFIAAFRTQLTSQQLLTLFPYILTFIRSPHYVVHTYAAYTIERMLLVKQTDTTGTTAVTTSSTTPAAASTYKISSSDFTPFVKPFLTALLTTIQSSDENRDNEYLLKAVLRIVVRNPTSVLSCIEDILTHLLNIMNTMAQQLGNPNAIHSLYEIMANLIVTVCTPDRNNHLAFEQALFPLFQRILTSDHQAEFSGYIFQLLALLLEYSSSPNAAVSTSTTSDLSAAYKNLFPSLLSPALYDNPSNVPSLLRLLCAYLAHGIHHSFTTSPVDTLSSVLGLLQKCLFHKKYHIHSLDLFIALITYIKPTALLQPYLPALLNMLFQKFQLKPGVFFFRKAVILMSVLVIHYHADVWLQLMNSIQPNISLMVLEKIVLPYMVQCTTVTQRKAVLVCMKDLLYQTQLMLTEAYVSIWVKLLVASVELYETTPVPDAINLVVEDEEPESRTVPSAADPTTNHQPSSTLVGDPQYSRLVYAIPPVHDYAPSVPDVNVEFLSATKTFFATHSQQFSPPLWNHLRDESHRLQKFFTQHSISM